jgi:hypothetical protein
MVTRRLWWIGRVMATGGLALIFERRWLRSTLSGRFNGPIHGTDSRPRQRDETTLGPPHPPIGRR